MVKPHKEDTSTNSTPGPVRRALLNLENGDRSGLKRAIQHLLGRKTESLAPIQAGDEKLSHSTKNLVLVETALKTLSGLGFEVVPGTDPNCPGLTHPLAGGRVVALSIVPTPDKTVEELALAFAVIHFPEMEFFLPYILARAKYQAAHRQNGVAPLGPEPEYDEDGFLGDID